jgi:NAD(P)-dependent dehydrogenase (short-subunit alcohol dehydrogenase family)
MSAASAPLHGRICLVTGATSGIGRVTAQALAQQGATVVLVARDPSRAAATVGQIKQQTGNLNVASLLADLSAQDQVRRLAAEFTSQYAQLHVLVNNAGALFWRRHETADGQERTFALNHLAPFLLTNLLLDTLKASAPSRIVTTASAAHTGAAIPFDDLQQAHHRYRGFAVYGQTKLANLLFTYELARRLAGSGVTANAFHPGYVATNFGRSDSHLMSALMPLANRFAISPEKGADTATYLATSPDVAGVSGQYFTKRQAIRSSPASYDEAAQRRLWEASAQLTGLAT